MPPPVFRRYVALGDSSTEGLDDPKDDGSYRGWSERLATHLAAVAGGIEYANLAVRGLTTREVVEGQLRRALELRPDLVTLFVGTNDVTARSFDEGRFAAELHGAQASLRRSGAVVLGFTLPDLSAVMPLARFVRGRVMRMNERIREVSLETGSLCVDFAAAPVTADPRLWSEDRIHANSEGHRRMSEALAHALGLEGFAGWDEPLDAARSPGALGRLGDEVSWLVRYFAPWIGRSLTGRSSGDGLRAKYPELRPWTPESAPKSAPTSERPRSPSS